MLPLHEIRRIKANYDVLIAVAGGDTLRVIQSTVFFHVLNKRRSMMPQNSGKVPLWLRLLPPALRVQIEHKVGLRRALTNTGWLFGERFLRLGVGFLVWMLMARYLGPAQFGKLNFHFCRSQASALITDRFVPATERCAGE